MSEPLVFMMGKFAAEFPTDRLYAKNHMWGQKQEDCIRFGFTAYAVRLLQDVYFLDWAVDADVLLKERQEIGSIESKKAESSLYAPIAGRLMRFNEELLSDPSAINLDKYGGGWLFEIEGTAEALMTAERYLEHLAGVWEIAQRTIKGQMNE
jgi:glycine cleavage system H protein